MVAVAAIVAQEAGGAVVGRKENVQIAIVIVIAVDGTSRDHGNGERFSNSGRNVLELFPCEVSEQEWRFFVADFRLHSPDLFLDMTVSGEDVGIAVEIVVEEERSEGQ